MTNLVEDIVPPLTEDWHNVKVSLEQKEKQEVTITFETSFFLLERLSLCILIEIIGSLWSVLQEKQKELSHLHKEYLQPPAQLLESMDMEQNIQKKKIPFFCSFYQKKKKKTVKEDSKKKKDIRSSGNYLLNIGAIDPNNYPKFEPTLDEKSSLVQQRLVRLHRLSHQLSSTNDDEVYPKKIVTGYINPPFDMVCIYFFGGGEEIYSLKKAESGDYEQELSGQTLMKTPRLLSQASMHRIDDSEISKSVVNELQLITDCYECGAPLTRMLDPVNANETVGIICGGCGRSKQDLKTDEFYYHCTSCESLDLCIVCVARR
ncbi:hypothetical protein RFI_20019 [Reticulomyxa filosa]|uniref:ZZ-type domain-containing protein n=1 Tax=Reticulomyxa filosa TaxID=46433 RepID=X6MW26_RETFI|nr:hypothetical protein RFI_20019 [Reticulomyxa filosa]|eukprot:ETO17305.1 hypothetical protein RFI_20019 [Reticulomyxa filosa]